MNIVVMEIENTIIEVLPKESLTDMKFISEDVLDSEPRRRLRNIYLKKAELLGNSYKGKVKIYFKNHVHKIFAVETTLWYVDENNISLKGGINIPTKSVVGIDF